METRAGIQGGVRADAGPGHPLRFAPRSPLTSVTRAYRLRRDDDRGANMTFAMVAEISDIKDME